MLIICRRDSSCPVSCLAIGGHTHDDESHGGGLDRFPLPKPSVVLSPTLRATRTGGCTTLASYFGVTLMTMFVPPGIEISSVFSFMTLTDWA